MHEFSLVKSLLQHVDRVLVENHSAIANVIEVEIGPLSGAEPELVRSAFEQLAINSEWRDTKLIVRESALVVQCLQCQSDTRLNDFVFRCSHCDSGAVRVIEGDEFRLLSVTIEEAETQPTENAFNQECAGARQDYHR